LVGLFQRDAGNSGTQHASDSFCEEATEFSSSGLRQTVRMRDSMILWDLASRYDVECISGDITLPVRARATYAWSVALGILGAIGVLVLSVSLIVDSTSLAALRGAGFAVFRIFLGMGARLYLSVCRDASYRRFGMMGRWFNVASGWFFQSCAVIMDLIAIGILLLGWAESASHAKGAPGVYRRPGQKTGPSVLSRGVSRASVGEGPGAPCRAAFGVARVGCPATKKNCRSEAVF
jgi:hypothetical protein